MIKKADRDAILAMLEDPMVRYKEILVRLVNALPCEAGTEVPVEEERSSYPDIEPIPRAPSVTLTKEQAEQLRHNSGHLASAEPDFAAMAEEIWHKRWAHGPADNGKESFMVACVDVLRANAHRFDTPAPAVVRDEAWWWRQAELLLKRLDDWRHTTDPKLTSRAFMADLLRSTFAAELAFDVETFIKKFATWMAVRHGWSVTSANTLAVCDVLRAVAREMGLGKGGA
jgi:hypothetical protein